MEISQPVAIPENTDAPPEEAQEEVSVAEETPEDKLEFLRGYELLVKAAMDQLIEEGPPVEGGEMMPPPPIEPVG